MMENIFLCQTYLMAALPELVINFWGFLLEVFDDGIWLFVLEHVILRWHTSKR